MDFLPDSIASLIQENPAFQQLASTSIAFHVHNARVAYVEPYIFHLKATYLDPYIIQPLATMLASSMPDLVSVLVLVLILIISLKVLDYARRVVMFWVTLVLRLVWWGFALGAIWYVYNAGVEKTGQDLGWLYGVAKGFVEKFQDGRTSSQATGGWGGVSSGREFQVNMGRR
ncbi:nuclear pore assembly and biogenesis-domain-containing protein [Aspergillus coremiiformis]|uniref:Nuclear pore assembly and biogenesis-domain-containing protein n=1 Tax=Aspergillus coremiiformis TaxID=138285 RepID=A0A5N6YTQ7_9EURO|nr:nuclear pore assembly and biogenesis-domain-containing protein [Aspergillus coremiiformis]